MLRSLGGKRTLKRSIFFRRPHGSRSCFTEERFGSCDSVGQGKQPTASSDSLFSDTFHNASLRRILVKEIHLIVYCSLKVASAFFMHLVLRVSWLYCFPFSSHPSNILPPRSREECQSFGSCYCLLKFISVSKYSSSEQVLRSRRTKRSLNDSCETDQENDSSIVILHTRKANLQCT